MHKLIKYVDTRAAKLFDKQAKRLGLRPNGRYLKYLVLQFAVTYGRDGQEKTREMVLDTLAANQKKVTMSKPKMLHGLDSETKRLFGGYNDFMDCGGQAEFLKYLVLQHKIHEDAMEFEDLKAIVLSYVA